MYGGNERRDLVYELILEIFVIKLQKLQLVVKECLNRCNVCVSSDTKVPVFVKFTFIINSNNLYARRRVLMGVPSCQLTTNFSAKWQLTTNCS